MDYKIELETAGQKYKGAGNTMLGALESIPITWYNLKAKGIFYFTDGKNQGKKIVYLKPLKKIFANKTRKAGWARQMERLLPANNIEF